MRMAMDGGHSSLGFQNLASSWPPDPQRGVKACPESQSRDVRDPPCRGREGWATNLSHGF